MSEYESLPPQASTRDDPCNLGLVSFLDVMQKYDTDMLTTTWQPALEPLGEGNTASISQSHVNQNLVFAYKRSTDEVNYRDKNNYEYMIKELIALQSPNLKSHPNIIDLYGVCWELKGDLALPVLVFPKAELGDLKTLVESQAESELNFDARVSLCRGIARGLRALHDAGIIHGDIKPQNMLVYLCENGSPIAKVADLGYSARGSDDELVRLPKSRPWVDPSWNRRPLRIKQAKSMDVYSFGMVCAWSLFGTGFSNANALLNAGFDKGTSVAVFFPNDAPLSVMEKLQAQDKLSTFMTIVIDETLAPFHPQKKSLIDLFKSILRKDNTSRLSDWSRITLLLSHNDDVRPPTPESNGILPEHQHTNFQVARYHYQLCAMDYRVRRTVVNALESLISRPNNACCVTCRGQVSTQLAVCCSLGFGTARDREKALHYLHQSEQDETKLHHELSLIRSRALDSSYRVGTFRDLFDLGFINGEDLPRRYRADGDLSAALRLCEAEYIDMKASLGETHAAVLLLQFGIVSLLEEDDKLEEAQSRCIQTLQSFEATFGPNHPDTIICREKVAKLWYNRRFYHKALEVQEEVVALRSREQGSEHVTTLGAVANLTMTYRQVGRLRDAIERQSQVVERFNDIFGPRHAQTLEAMDALSRSLFDDEKFDESLDMRRKIVDMKRHVLGTHHPDTVQAEANLAPLYKALERYSEAEDTYLKSLKFWHVRLGALNEATLVCKEKLTNLYANMGKLDIALLQQVQLVADRIKKHGADDSRVWRSKVWLARLYLEGDRVKEADELTVEFMKRCEHVSDTDVDPAFLDALSESVVLLVDQTSYEKAEELGAKLLELEKQNSTNASRNTITSTNNLAVCLIYQGKFDGAKPLLQHAWDSLTNMLGPKHPDTLQTAFNLGQLLVMMKDYAGAERSFRAIRSTYLEKFGAHDSRSLETTGSLYDLYDQIGAWEKAQPLAEDLVLQQQARHGSQHPQTLAWKRKLAITLRKSQQPELATELLREIYQARLQSERGSMETLAAGTELFDVYRSTNCWTDAIEVLETLIEVASINHKHDSPTVVMCKAQFAYCSAALGRIQEAQDMQQDIISSLPRTEALAPYRTTLIILSSLASKYADFKRWDESESLLELVFAKAAAALGDEHETTLIAKGNLVAVRRERHS